MRNPYRPRRANKRWMKDAPDYILSVHDHPNFVDRYTIYFVPNTNDYTNRADCDILYLACNDSPTHPQGFSMFGAVNATQRQLDHRVKWLDLPENVRKHVMERYTRED